MCWCWCKSVRVAAGCWCGAIGVCDRSTELLRWGRSGVAEVETAPGVGAALKVEAVSEIGAAPGGSTVLGYHYHHHVVYRYVYRGVVI